MNSEEIAAFWEEYCRIRQRYPSQRRGQAMMNAMAKIRPDLYDLVSQTDADCFYLDSRTTDFKRKVGLIDG